MYKSKNRRKFFKRILSVILSIILFLCLIPSISLKTLAEGDDEASQIEDVSEEDGYAVLTEGSVKKGDIIKFGHYEQDGDESNGKEAIEWEVLKVESDRLLVVSIYALDCQKYNDTRKNVTWETCSLRQWLNNDFKNTAFSSAEQANIPTVTIENKNNPYGAAGGNITNDQIFCLSLEEIESYFGNYNYYDSENMIGCNQNLICTPTQYVENNGAFVYTITESDYNQYYKRYGYTSNVIGRRAVCWWLRSSGDVSHRVCYVSASGDAGASLNGDVNHGDAVRPAMYINLSAVESEPSDSKEIVYSGTSAITHEPFSYTTTFSPSDLSMPASKSNYNLAMVCGMLSKAVYHDANQEEDKNILKQMGIEGYDSHFEGKSWNYSFGYDSFMLNGVDTNVIVISIKGTNSEDEIAADRIMDAGKYKMYGQRVFDVPYGFKEEIKLYFNDLANNHPELKTKPLKIIVTGHSLGGATANLLAAELTAEENEWYSDWLDKEDVFCYTFGAIDSKDAWDPNHPGTVKEGFENIHNIYNVYDTFGWFGNVGIATTNGNGIFGKFGHMDFFKIDVKDKELNLFGDTKGYNHDIVLYMDAVYQRLICNDLLSRENLQGVTTNLFNCC